MTTLFLLAHQDDEIGVFHKIAEKHAAEVAHSVST